MNEITVAELKRMMDAKENFQLVDIREQYELETCTIGGENIPMGEIFDDVDRIARDKKVIIMCRSGNRSGSIIQALEAREGFENLYNLKGGILAWANEIDTTLTQY